MANSQSHVYLCILCLCFIFHVFVTVCSEDKVNEKTEDEEKWKKKHITDYNDADLERLLEQWDENDEDQVDEPDELPEWKRPPPQVDLTKLDMSNPENVLKATKQGRTLMMFVTVSGNPKEKETEEITKLWQGMLFNAHIELQRYVVGDDRALFVLKDGSKAWEIKDFLVEQDRCATVTIEGQDYPGKGAKKAGASSAEGTKKDKKAKRVKPKKDEF